jgi:hypothetical protein
MPLHGATSLADTIYPSVFGETTGAKPENFSSTPVAASREVTTNTGLVVDARGIQARPAMSPKIIDENGQEVYGTMQVDREIAVQQGMSGYSRDINTIRTNPRVTDNPLILKGLKTDGPGKSNIVIRNADAEQIRASRGSSEFLKNCRVMIVLD